MDEQRFYKRNLGDSEKYIQVLHMMDDGINAEVIQVQISIFDYLSDYTLTWVAAKWDKWTPISKQDFFAAVAQYAAIDAELGN